MAPVFTRKNIPGLALIALLLLWAFWEFWNFTPDDAFIHFAFIKNLAQRGEFSVNAGRSTFGTTSPLWVLINIPFALLAISVSGPEQIPFFVKLNGLGFSILAVLLAGWVVRRWGGSSLASITAMLLLSGNAWFARWSVSGMESSMILCLFFSILAFAQSEKPWIRFGLSGFLIGLFPLARPEGILWIGIGFCSILFGSNRPKIKHWIYFFGSLLIPLVLWMVFAEYHFGTLIPNTVIAKSRGIAWFPSFSSLRRLLSILGSGWLVSILGVIIGSGLLLYRKGIHTFYIQYHKYFLLWAWPMGLFLGYLFSQSSIVSRYLLMAAPGFTFLFVLIVQDLELSPYRERKVLLLAILISFSLNTGFRELKIAPLVKEYSENFPHYRQLPETLKEIASPEDWLAVGDVGIPAFYGDQAYQVLDLHGLVSPEAIEFKKQGKIEKLLIEKRPRFLIDRAASPRFLLEQGCLENPEAKVPHLVPIAKYIESVPLGKAGVAETEDLYYSLYELDWDRWEE